MNDSWLQVQVNPLGLWYRSVPTCSGRSPCCQATLIKKSVSCRPGETTKDHLGGREFFFRNIYFLM